MIQLTSVTPFSKANNTDLATPAQPAQSSSFQSQLSAALNATLEKFGVDPSKVNITIGSSALGSGSLLSGPKATAALAAGASSSNKVPAAVPNPPTATPAAATDNTPDNSSVESIIAYNDAYWAKQPAAVQALQNVDDPLQRSLMAGQLASEGYTIDVPIMVWGWGPSAVTDLRTSYGYTWVPSAMQSAITEAPGLSTPGLAPYDPNNPPAGSIMV